MHPRIFDPVPESQALLDGAWSCLASSLVDPAGELRAGQLGVFDASGETHWLRQRLHAIEAAARVLHGDGPLVLPGRSAVALAPRAVWVCSDPRARLQAVFGGVLKRLDAHWQLRVDTLSVARRDRQGQRHHQQWAYDAVAPRAFPALAVPTRTPAPRPRCSRPCSTA